MEKKKVMQCGITTMKCNVYVLTLLPTIYLILISISIITYYYYYYKKRKMSEEWELMCGS